MKVPGYFLHLRMHVYCIHLYTMSVSVFVGLIRFKILIITCHYMRLLFLEVFSLLKVEMLCRILIKSQGRSLRVSKARIFVRLKSRSGEA